MKIESEPHKLCVEAAKKVQQYILEHPELRADADKGKMFGVLVVEGGDFLAAYSGLLAGRNDWEWFVPPVYDAQQPEGYFKRIEMTISSINDEINKLEEKLEQEIRGRNEKEREIEEYRKKIQAAKILRDAKRLHHNLSPEEEAELIRESQFMKAELHRMKKRLATSTPISDELEDLRRKRREMSEDLQRWLFSQYKLLNYKGEEKTVLEIFSPQIPPAATGDCCAPKLLQYAYSHGMKPLHMAEFWWGESPKQEIRHHLHFYPPCKGRCMPLLNWMLPALPTPSFQGGSGRIFPHSPIYEDHELAVIVKPAGMLAVPGKTGEVSVYDIMRQRYPDTDSPLIVHRLDQATSGIMVIAKTIHAYRHLQRQFSEHTIEKHYVAVLESNLSLFQEGADGRLVGQISLPLRPDLNDRPRQVVDCEHGKPAVTRWEILPSVGEELRIRLYPKTGRTHQLRVHCAHKEGLNNPILGDTLYGSKKADRLYLHADRLSLTHPTTNERLTFESPAPF